MPMGSGLVRSNRRTDSLVKKPLNGVASFKLLVTRPRRGNVAGQLRNRSRQTIFDDIVRSKPRLRPFGRVSKHTPYSPSRAVMRRQGLISLANAAVMVV